MTVAVRPRPCTLPSLAAAGVDTPRLDAQLLLAWTLKARREDLARDPERVLTERERVIFEKAVALRVLRRPLPYITGEAWFYGRPFKINRAVLIPRPETEDLAAAALEACRDVPSPILADIGTGSGCLAVTLALEHPGARVWATDLSGDALKLARKNVVRHGPARARDTASRRPARAAAPRSPVRRHRQQPAVCDGGRAAGPPAGSARLRTDVGTVRRAGRGGRGRDRPAPPAARRGARASEAERLAADGSGTRAVRERRPRPPANVGMKTS